MFLSLVFAFAVENLLNDSVSLIFQVLDPAGFAPGLQNLLKILLLLLLQVAHSVLDLLLVQLGLLKCKLCAVGSRLEIVLAKFATLI